MDQRAVPRSGRRVRRAVVAAAALATTSLVLAACSSPSGSSSSASGGTAKEITVVLIPSPTEDAIKKRIPDFETQTGVKVKVVDSPYDDAHQKDTQRIEYDLLIHQG